MDYKIKPWDHQEKAIERAKDLSAFALYMDPGLGKTSTAINILRHKFAAHKRPLKTLIFCPPIVITNWVREWGMHSKLKADQVRGLTGSGKKRFVTFYGAEAPIFVTNYESLLMDDLFKAFKEWGPECLVFDESHKLKNYKAGRSKLAEELSALPSVKYKYLLTGTPVLNSPMDLFMQMKIMDPSIFGKNFFAFRARFFTDKNAGMPKERYFPNWVVGQDTIKIFNQILMNVGAVAKKSECLDLPDLVRTTIEVELSPKQRKHYDEMKKDLITFLEGPDGQKPALATIAITKLMRLQQILSGFVKTVSGEEVSFEETPREAALKELLEELTPGHKVLVWCVWKNNYEQVRKVCAALGVKFVEVHGDISASVQRANVDLFNMDDSVRVFIGHPGSGGIGINLVAASYSIFYSRNFSLEHSLQAEARNYRGGSEIHEKITRIDIVAKNTIDEKITKVLANKEELGNDLLIDIGRELVNEPSHS